MKAGLKKFALAAMALASITPGIEPVKAEQGTVQTARQKEAIKHAPIDAKQFVKAHAGGFNIISHDHGIPRHIYGQFYVRRGTHKRTNKK